MNPRISIIIPAFNAAPYLGQCIRSALNQTEKRVEVIVVDDASTDGTLAVAQSFSDSRVTVLHNTHNRGPSVSRNRGLAQARGDWIALLDADDWYARKRLERLLRAAEEAQADLVVDDHYRIRDGEDVPFTTQFRTTRRPLLEPRFVDPVFFVRTTRTGQASLRLGCSKPLMRRAFLASNQLAYEPDIWFCEDFLFYLRCLVRGARFLVIPEPMYFRRIHPDSITGGDLVAMLEHEIGLMDRLLCDPEIRYNARIRRAIRRHQNELHRHLAFRRLERRLTREEAQLPLDTLRLAPPGLVFAAQRATDRARHALLHHWQKWTLGRDAFEPPHPGSPGLGEPG